MIYNKGKSAKNIILFTLLLSFILITNKIDNININLLYFLLLFIILLTIFNIYNMLYRRKETFTVQFGTPEESSDENVTQISTLLEIGSQAEENTTYDTVSTQVLGDITVTTPAPPIEDEEDPVCFEDDDEDDEDNIFSLLY